MRSAQRCSGADASAREHEPDEDGGYDVVLTRSARRALQELLPEAVAAAAFEFIAGPLRSDPHRVGKPLREPLAPCGQHGGASTASSTGSSNARSSSTLPSGATSP